MLYFCGAAGISSIFPGCVCTDVMPSPVNPDTYFKRTCRGLGNTNVFVRSASRVSRFGSARSPNTIRFLVIACIVNTLKCVPCWARTHVSIKLGELFPSNTHSDAASPVVMKVGVVGVGHTLEHVVPAPVFTRRSETVRGLPCDNLFRSQASTRRRLTRAKALAEGTGFLSAVAHTNPARMTGVLILASA